MSTPTLTLKTHIVFFSQMPIFGGGEVYLVNLLRCLPTDKYKLTCICTYDHTLEIIKKKVNSDKVRFLFVPQEASPSIWNSIWPMYKILKLLKPDILHLNGIDMYGCSYATLAGKIAGIPVILGTIHMSKPYQPYNFLENIFRFTIDRLLDGAIAVSEHARVNALFYRYLLQENIVAIRNGIDISKYSIANTHRNEQFLRLGAVARLVPSKGIDNLLDTAKLLLQTNQEILFLIAGDGPERDHLVGLAVQLGIENAVYFIGWQNNIQDFLANIDVYVSCSRSEGLGLATIEAMASGLPVVCTDVGGVSEVVIHGETGFLTPVNDPSALAQSIQILLDNPELRREMGQAGRKRVEQYFTVEKMVLGTQQYYLDLLSRKHRKTGEHSGTPSTV